MRVVVIGGYGNFGARVCRGLAGAGMEVIAAGRNPDEGESAFGDLAMKHARLDHAAPEFPADLKRLSPDLVIHCAGPFQSQNYRVARAALAAGSHYFDLADGRQFVSRFAQNLQSAARAADRLAVSGASSVPALSSAVISSLRARLPKIEEIQIAIAPGQRAPRGRATLAAVFSYAGRPFKWVSGGEWRDAWGWQELRRIRFYGLGARWAAACDVPDLELFPRLYPGVQVPLERWAGPLGWIAARMNVFGGQLGDMLVSVLGRRADGSRARAEWHLTADALHGPEIPCMPAVLLARKLANGGIAQRGAFACTGFLELPEFEREFAHWRITTVVREQSA